MARLSVEDMAKQLIESDIPAEIVMAKIIYKQIWMGIKLNIMIVVLMALIIWATGV